MGIVVLPQTIPGNPAKGQKIMQDKVTSGEGLALEPPRGPTLRSSLSNLSLSAGSHLLPRQATRFLLPRWQATRPGGHDGGQIGFRKNKAQPRWL